jgi:tyrosyl-tRNA synthetase
MQCTDIFFLKADICQLGMDQRKVNTLAREYCSIDKTLKKPIILSHHMLPGFKDPNKFDKEEEQRKKTAEQ